MNFSSDYLDEASVYHIQLCDSCHPGPLTNDDLNTIYVIDMNDILKRVLYLRFVCKMFLFCFFLHSGALSLLHKRPNLMYKSVKSCNVTFIQCILLLDSVRDPRGTEHGQPKYTLSFGCMPTRTNLHK